MLRITGRYDQADEKETVDKVKKMPQKRNTDIGGIPTGTGDLYSNDLFTKGLATPSLHKGHHKEPSTEINNGTQRAQRDSGGSAHSISGRSSRPIYFTKNITQDYKDDQKNKAVDDRRSHSLPDRGRLCLFEKIVEYVLLYLVHGYASYKYFIYIQGVFPPNSQC